VFFVNVVVAEQETIQEQNHPQDQGSIHIEMLRMWKIYQENN
jgi:hypothetical protein|tara:strand:+ start:162 stop:287 length:126 start_codon:yes stop_codon:yes gene_type:complete